MSNHLRRWGVVYFLTFFWLSFMAVHAWLEWKADSFPTMEEVPWEIEWLRGTFENIQSEVFQIVVACLFVDAKFRRDSWFRAKEE
jgi:hypothetical protein